MAKKKPKRLSAKALKDMKAGQKAAWLSIHAAFSGISELILSADAESGSDFADLQFQVAVMKGETDALVEDNKK